jgi:hypothetical protein
MLGFVPAACIVGFVHGVPGRAGPVVVRVDLGRGPAAQRATSQLALGIAGTGGTSVDLVVWVEVSDSCERADLPGLDMLRSLRRGLDDTCVEVLECVVTNGSTYWSVGCGDPVCCPDVGRALDRAEMTAVQAEFVYAGRAPLSSREELAATIARDEDRAAQVARFLRAGRRPVKLESWRDQQVGFISRALVPSMRPPHATTPADSGLGDARRAARIIRALDDIRVRDTVLLRLIREDLSCEECRRDAVELWSDVVRAAPAGRVAPAATILALLTWWLGQGALASLALQRALDDDPEYRLASLAGEVMARGTDPHAWLSSMARLTEAECRGLGCGEVR